MAGALVLVLALGGAAIAWACAPHATLSLAPDRGAAGITVQAEANGFSSFPLDTPIEVRWNGPNGPVLYSGRPGLLDGGQAKFTITIPGQQSPGDYLVIATQYGFLGGPIAGTPARTFFTVV